MVEGTTNPIPERPLLPALCRYAGKKCANTRSIKRNGRLHSLCHYHRVRANQNQRRMAYRRRIQQSRKDIPTVVYLTHPAGLATNETMPWLTSGYDCMYYQDDAVWNGICSQASPVYLSPLPQDLSWSRELTMMLPSSMLLPALHPATFLVNELEVVPMAATTKSDVVSIDVMAMVEAANAIQPFDAAFPHTQSSLLIDTGFRLTP